MGELEPRRRARPGRVTRGTAATGERRDGGRLLASFDEKTGLVELELVASRTFGSDVLSCVVNPCSVTADSPGEFDRRGLGRFRLPRGAGLAFSRERAPPQVHPEGVRRALQPGSAPPQPRASPSDRRSPAWRS